MRDRWTAELVGLLQQLWEDGLTAEAIGAELGGLSRSAVLGKILRLRRGAKCGAAPTMRSAHRRGRKRHEPPPPAPSSEPKRLLDLTNHCCRWPIAGPGAGEILFCGAPEADLSGGMPYCAYHARRAYVIPPQRAAAAKPNVAAATAAQPDAAPPARPRYVWRAAVRHPAPRRR